MALAPGAPGWHLGSVGRKKISTTVYITPEQDELLKQLSRVTKVPAAEYVREGIDLVIEKHREKLPGQTTLPLVLPGH